MFERTALAEKNLADPQRMRSEKVCSRFIEQTWARALKARAKVVFMRLF